MKTANVSTNQPVQGKKTVAQNTAQATKLLTAAQEPAVATEVKAVPKAAKVKKDKTARPLSMEHLADQLRATNADAAAIESAFIAAYKVKGIEEITFIRKRIEIYLKISDKRIAASAATLVKA
jgi:hypothetical protein